MPEAVSSTGDYRFRVRDASLGGAMLFVAFGALVLLKLLIPGFPWRVPTGPELTGLQRKPPRR
jgi:hypothetical protein